MMLVRNYQVIVFLNVITCLVPLSYSWRVEDENEELSTSNRTYFVQGSTEDPLQFRVCRQLNTMELNGCLREVLEEMKPRIALGIPELGLPGVDPLMLSNLSFVHGNAPVRIASQFNDVEITGISQFNKSDFWVDPQNRKLDYDINFPHLLLAGSYNLSGNIFLLPISGDGYFWLSLVGVRSKGSGELAISKDLRTIRNEVTLRNTKLELEIDSIKVHLTNLFNGDRLLGPVLNNFLNDNSLEIFDELKPQIREQVGEILMTLANNAFAALPPEFLDAFTNTDGPAS